MALTVTGLLDEARAAYLWSAQTQRDDGSWPMQTRAGVVEIGDADTNFCAYLATGVLHYVLATDDDDFAVELWPTVRAGIEFVLGCQVGRYGEIGWCANEHGGHGEALLAGCASIYHSLGCAIELAERLADRQPAWAAARRRLGTALRAHPDAFLDKQRYSMDWYYPVLGGAVRGAEAHARIAARWDEFVVPGLGIRCVADAPWATGAETCELALALDTIGDHDRAATLVDDMQHLRETDGSYWTGLVFADGKRWPEERTSWTGAAVILATDAITRGTPANGIFRDHPAAH
ncbi:prenyltransferase [Skermania piniformis]|nr:prenyltransferase [Skermania piniformis]